MRRQTACDTRRNGRRKSQSAVISVRNAPTRIGSLLLEDDYRGCCPSVGTPINRRLDDNDSVGAILSMPLFDAGLQRFTPRDARHGDSVPSRNRGYRFPIRVAVAVLPSNMLAMVPPIFSAVCLLRILVDTSDPIIDVRKRLFSYRWLAAPEYFK